MDCDALGLVCDPEEISDGASVQVQVSASSPAEKSFGIFTSLRTNPTEQFDCSQDMFSQNEMLVDETVPSDTIDFSGMPLEISQTEDEIEDIEETQINQSWSRSSQKVVEHSQIIQQTMVFEAIEPSQRWSFSQLERTQNKDRIPTRTPDIRTSPEPIPEKGPSQLLQQTMIFEPLEPSQRWTFSQLEHTQDTNHIPTQSLNTIEEVSICSSGQETQLPPSQDHTEIPTSIRDLYTSVTQQYSEFCFSYTLASQLCPQICPMNTYTDLKLCLLLSIASIHKHSLSSPFHVICIGPDTTIANLLMRSIGQLARRFITAMLDPIAGGRVLHDNFVECGSTTLARTGVCYLGNWSAQKPTNAARILREIESGQVIIENHAIAGYPLECAIWSNWNYTRKAKRDMSTIVAFLNNFGIPIMLPEETPDAMASFMLEHSLADHEPTLQEPLVSDEDVREFLAMTYFQTVTVSEEANNLLTRYFVLTRSNVPESLTQSSLLALQKLSEAHARLCFRSEVSRLDAVVAIMICERFVHAVFSNPGNAAPLLENLESIDDVERYFDRFDQWLQEFLNKSYDS